MNLSSRDLRAVVALMDECNFTRAAERVHLSQSAFSTLIQNVEESLGARLFDRTTRNVVLTPEGRLLEPSARRVLADLEGMVSDFRDHAQRRKGRVAVAALPSIAAGWLPSVLAEFRSTYPGIELALHDALSEQCLGLLRTRQVDLALAATGEPEADLAAEALCEDEFHLICPRGHPLAKLPQVRPRDLVAWPFVHMSRHSSVRQHLEAAFHPMKMRTVLEVEHLATATGLVEAGLGITVVPALTLFHFDRPGLVVRKLDARGLTRRVLILQRRNDALSAAAQGLLELMLLRKPGSAGKAHAAGRPPRARAASARQRLP